jgi:hypothetical protein
MANLESINNRLLVASRLLDQAAEEIRDAQFAPTRGNIEHIGKALSEIFELQHKIYEVMPELKPNYLNEESPSPEADGLLTEFLGEAIGLEDAENNEGAIAKLEEFLLLESTPHHKEIARSEIARLKGE